MLSRNPILAILLAALLLVTSQSMAVARGTMQDASGAIVICTGAGYVTVLVDENGQPIEAEHICPDCAATPMLADPGGETLAAPVRMLRSFKVRVEAARANSYLHTPSQARGPPMA